MLHEYRNDVVDDMFFLHMTDKASEFSGALILLFNN